jgi:sterol 3beta-glucosyltransferase
MKVSVFAIGSRGDVQPPAALAARLVQRGHTVQLIAPAEFASLVEGRNFQFCGLDGNMHAMVQEALRSKNPFTLFGRVVEHLGGFFARWTQEAYDYAKDADIIVGVGGGALGGASLAQKLNRPYAVAFLQPTVPTAEFPSPAFRPLPLPGFLNKAEHWLALQGLWQIFRPIGNKVRRDVLGLGPVPFSPNAILYRDGFPVLLAVSPSVFPPPPEWRGRADATGYWFLDSLTDYQPPADLTAFLAAGPPPVYFGFGSMILDDPKKTVAAILTAVKRVGCRAVISAGWAGLAPEHVTPDIYAGDNLPHDWLLPRMASVCHHGGAGTSAAAMRAGKPSIIVPFFADQPFFGWWLHKIGVGTAPIKQSQLTADRLEAAIRQTLTDQALRDNAERLGAKIRAEDGATRAAELIERMAAR